MIGNPIKGTVRDYKNSRYMRGDRHSRPYSENGEVWEPGFIFPYITGRVARDVFQISLDLVERYLPYYTLRFKKEASRLLAEELHRLGLSTAKGAMNRSALLEFIIKGP